MLYFLAILGYLSLAVWVLFILRQLRKDRLELQSRIDPRKCRLCDTPKKVADLCVAHFMDWTSSDEHRELLNLYQTVQEQEEHKADMREELKAFLEKFVNRMLEEKRKTVDSSMTQRL